MPNEKRINIYFATHKIDHCLKIFFVAKTSGSTLYVLYNAIYTFKNSIRILIVEIIEYLIPMFAKHLAKLLHGLQL